MTLSRECTKADVDLDDGEQLIELRKGHRAILRDPDDVPERRRRPLENLIMAAGRGEVRDELAALYAKVGDRTVEEIGPEEIEAPSEATVELVGNMADYLILALVRDWTYGPVTLDVLLDAPAKDHETLQLVTAPMWAQVMPDFSPGGAVTRREDGTLAMNGSAPTRPSSV